MSFEEQHMTLLLEYEDSATEIERALFTNRHRLSDKQYSLLAVQSISILYSYWEGYVQKSFQLYIDYLNRENVPLFSFSPGIITHGFEHEFKQLKAYPKELKKKSKLYCELKRFFKEDYHELFRIVNTESNVGFKVLNNLLEQFSLAPFPECWDKYKYPNPNLKVMLETFLRYRNGVAHGGDISSEEKINKEVYAKYRILLIDLMYEMHNKFVFGLEHTTYLQKGIENHG